MWHYHGAEFTDATGYYGMVYQITNLLTGKKYIGRKYFTQSKIQAKTKTKRKKKLRVSSNWEQYYGSSADLLADIEREGKHHFQRDILRLCATRAETNYYEAYEILTRGALLSEAYYNKWVSLKLHATTLKHLHPSTPPPQMDDH